MKTTITARQIWSYIRNVLRPFPFAIFIMFFLSVVWAVDISLRPYLIKVILNRLASGSQQDVFVALVVPIVLYLSMNILMTTSYRLYDYFVEIKMIPRLRAKIANEALERLVDQSHAYYQDNFSGSLANKVNDLTSSVPEIVQSVAENFLPHALGLAIAIFTLWSVNSLFALSMILWTIFFMTGALFFSKRVTHYAANWSEFGSVITGKLVDTLSNILSVRLFSAKVQEKNALGQTFQGAVAAEQKLQWAYLWMWVCYGYSFVILQVFNFYFLCKGRQEGWITVGDFALVLILNISIVDFLWQVAKEFSQFSKLLGRIAQALKTILEVPDLQDKPGAHSLKITQGTIYFDQVQFYYKDTEALFNKKSVTLAAGQKVGLVGYSGGGKSTFVNLILRLYDVTSGRILIDGEDIRDVTQDSLRSNIAMIPQDPSLFHRSLMDNIRYGLMDASDEAVTLAAKRAHAHEFIIKLPQGYGSLVGERGVKLSGGQRQRIAIARAILKNAPILILDEATSQLDSLTESDIQDSLWELMQGKTTIVIAHRLSTLLRMDRILVFDQGKIIEDGSHDALLAKGGLYKTLWEAQVGGFLPERKRVS